MKFKILMFIFICICFSFSAHNIIYNFNHKQLIIYKFTNMEDKMFVNLEMYLEDCIKVIFGEGEECSYNEKVLIGITFWNRLINPFKLKFNDYKNDFAGYKRFIVLRQENPEYFNNKIVKEQFEYSKKAAEVSYKIAYSNDPKYNLYYFFLNKDKTLINPHNLSYYKLEEINIEGFMHTFYIFKIDKEKLIRR